MSIRRILILAFIGMGLVPALGLTLLAFSQAREALSSEIARNLEAQSVSLIEQVDRMLFERFENMRTWGQLDIMQDLRVRDLDKRVSDLLTDLKAGYGVYSHLFCTTTTGEVIAASEPYLIGSRVSPQPAWLHVPISAGSISVEPFTFTAPFEHLDLRLRAPLRDIFSNGEQLGILYALFDWSEVLHILDQVEVQSSASSRGRMAILLDADERLIAASALFRRKPLQANASRAVWPHQHLPPKGHSGAYLTDVDSEQGAWLVGFARSQGVQRFNGFGWSLYVLQPTDIAHRPIWEMGKAFMVLLTITAAFAVGVSLFIAARTARPIVALTDFTRRFTHEGATAAPPSTGPREIQELTQAYTQLMHDLDESREQLIRAAKLAVAGEMAAAMTHEIRTPLGILRSSAQMLQRESQLSEEGREMAGFVESETRRLDQLVSSLLSFARPRPPSLVLRDLHPIIQQTLAMLAPQAKRKQVRLVTAFQPGAAIFACDEEQMVQVFLNLFINALQVLRPGGEVTIRARTMDGQLTIEVADNGPGIPPEHHEKIFEPFFTTRENSIGLGLTVVQQILHGHHGKISVVQAGNGGACFVLQFVHQNSQNSQATRKEERRVAS